LVTGTGTVKVAARAEELAGAVPPADRELLVVAAWWHDLGYAPDLVQTGFHPIDGALYLAAKGHSPRLCGLVAHHSAATSRRRSGTSKPNSPSGPARKAQCPMRCGRRT
jgi:hypothetical protein